MLQASVLLSILWATFLTGSDVLAEEDLEPCKVRESDYGQAIGIKIYLIFVQSILLLLRIVVAKLACQSFYKLDIV